MRNCMVGLLVLVTLDVVFCESVSVCSDKRTNRVCYQCADRQLDSSTFSRVFNNCCDSTQEQLRAYCESIYIEPPSRGIVWMG
ncbi:hypothetical protein Btru_048963 [Bulinus truncatus]|nr:hypothetical protein Btru_048963 [Bulinus truncatus]